MEKAELPLAARIAVYAAMAAVLSVAPLLASPYALHVAMTACIAIILSLGLNLLMGYAGQISLASAAFYGIGAYAVAILGVRYEIPFWLGAPLTAAATAGLGLLVGLPALRVGGHYLALATLAFVALVQVVLVNWASMTGGSPGMRTSRENLGLGLLADDRRYYYLVVVVTLAMTLLAVRIVDSRTGRAFASIRDNENVAEIMGVDLARYKTMAFGLSAFYCAVAGALHAGLTRFLEPYEFGLWTSIVHLLYVVVGGLGSISGSILGPLLVVTAPETLRVLAEYRELVFGLLLLLTLMFFPEGLAGLLERLRDRRRLTAQAVATGSHMDWTPMAPRRASQRNDGLILAASGLSVAFGGLKALQGVDLSLEKGEIRALIGPNGAGKTTLLNVLSRVYDPDAGAVAFRDVDLLRRRAHGLASIGIVRTFQNLGLFDGMTVLENVMLGMHAHLKQGLIAAALGFPAARRESAKAKARARELLAHVGLQEFAEWRAAALPFGWRRRLELARALAAEPVLLLLDEPASGLDKEEIASLLQIIRALRDQLGVTILVIEHNVSFVMALADRISVLDHGVKIAEGSAAEIRSNPRVVEAYLGRRSAFVEG